MFRPIRALTLALLLLCSGSMIAQMRVNIMPGFPNAPRARDNQRHLARPSTPMVVWGNANGGLGTTPATAVYTWTFSSGQNFRVVDDGDLSGVVTADKFIFEEVSIELLNGATSEVVSATLTVSDPVLGLSAKTVEILVVDPTDPLSDTPLENQQIDANISIEDGLRSLYLQSSLIDTGDPSGPFVRWTGGFDATSDSAFALWAFQNQGHLPRDASYDEDIYAEWVQRGLNYLFSRATVITDLNAPRATMAYGATADSVADLNGNGQGAFFNPVDRGGDRGYIVPICACAVAAAADPARMIVTGPYANQTYKTLLEDVIDWLGSVQNVGGDTLSNWRGRGGWIYSPSTTQTLSDMSINSWAYVAMEGAEDVFGIEVPDWMKREIEFGLVAHQASDGRFGYRGTSSSANSGRLATSGGGMSGLVLTETARSYPAGEVVGSLTTGALSTIQGKRAAGLTWLGANWGQGNATSGQDYGRGNQGNYYSMWTVSRALRLTAKALGLPSGSKVTLTNNGVDFDWETGEELATGNLAAAGSDREGYFTWALRSQNRDPATVTSATFGSWDGWYRRPMATALSCLVLTPRVFQDPCPPTINIPITNLAPPPTARLEPGMNVTLSGRAVAQAPDRPVLAVQINGEPVDSLDAAGNFFKTVPLTAGQNTFIIRAAERCGFSETTYTLDAGASMTPFTNVTHEALQVQILFSNVSFNRHTGQLVATARAFNPGPDLVDAPLLYVLDNFTDPSVRVSNADGVTPEGKPYLIFLDPLMAPSLLPGQTSPPKVILLDNPNRVGFNFSARFISESNGAPFFVSAPPVTAVVGRELVYEVMADDPNFDALSFDLVTAPVGMSVVLNSGRLTWTPALGDDGVHDITVRVRDGRGGSATQRFQLEVLPVGRNGAPYFVSVPDVQSAVGARFVYMAAAEDPDRDPLTWTLPTAPLGMSISPAGEVVWDFVAPGLHPVVVAVADGQGGRATQSFQLAAGVPSTNPHAPVIFGVPAAVGAVEDPYRYQPTARDPDPGQTLTWSVITGPTGLGIDAAVGLVSWTPGVAQVGMHDIEIQVEDGAGGATTQAWSVEIVLDLPNRAPVITSLPDPTITDVLAPWTYTPMATDPDRDPLTWSLGIAPMGMSIDPMTGRVDWTPPATGTFTIGLQAMDPAGATGRQTFILDVLPPNQAPQITSSAPPVVAFAGGRFGHIVTAMDPDSDPLQFRLLSAPSGMEIGALNGHLTWQPTAAQTGMNGVLVEVSDGRGGTDTQAFALDVQPDNQAPLVEIVFLPDPNVVVGLARNICVRAADNVGVIRRTLTIDGNPVVLDGFGCTTYTPTAAGMLSLAATAEDPAGNVGNRLLSVLVVDPSQGAPDVTIHAPLPGEIVTKPTDIVATITTPANPPRPLAWTARLRNVRTGSTKEIATGTNYPNNEVIGRIDPTLLCNDGYVFELLVDDVAFSSTEPVPVSVAGDFKLGNFTYATVDLGLEVGDLPITIARVYDSLDTTPSDFGRGWRLGLNARVDDTPREGPGSAETFLQGTRVYVTKLDGRRVGFTARAETISPFFPFVVNLRFDADPGNRDQLELEDPSPVFFTAGMFFGGLFSEPFNPDRYVFTSESGLRMKLSEADGLQEVRDINGNTLSILPTGIVSSLGPSIDFTRDKHGRITEILEPQLPGKTGPRPSIQYGYDPLGNLMTVRNQLNAVTTLSYDEPAYPHYLTGIMDPMGRPVLRNAFDAEGRLLYQCGPDGDIATGQGCIRYDLDPGRDTQTIFDGRGNRTDLVLDELGNVLTRRRWKSDLSDFLESSRTYLPGTLLPTSLTDEDGRLWTFEYDADENVVAMTEPGGGRWAFEWTIFGKMATTIDPAGRALRHEYDARENLRFMVGPTGARTELVYNTIGQLSQIIDPAGASWGIEYDSEGRPIRSTDPQGRVSTSMYDARGDLAYTIDREGQRIDFVHDDAHQVIMETWSTNPQSIFSYQYDMSGRLRSAAGPGTMTTLDYWNSGELKSTSNLGTPGAPLIEILYGERMPGGMLRKGYDGNGNLTSVWDSFGGELTYEYDDYDRLVALKQGSSMGSAIDKAVLIDRTPGGKIAAIRRYRDLAASLMDCESILETGLPNEPGRLSRVLHRLADGTVLDDMQIQRDPAGFITGIGNQGLQTAYGHDGIGRLVSADHPATSVLPDESYDYDPAGNRQSSHLGVNNDYGYETGTGAGTHLERDDTYDYAYDDNGALTERVHRATGERLLFTHDFRGRTTSIELRDSGGAVLTRREFYFDATNRKIREVRDGVGLWIGYDGRNPILWVDDAGQVQRRALYGRELDSLFATETPADGLQWVLSDEVGTVRHVVGAGGTLAGTLEHDSYGRRLGATGGLDAFPFGFHARPLDADLGLYDFRARWYDPDTGRFLAEDSQSPHDYVFGMSSPLIMRDPTGESVLVEYACLALTAVKRAKVIAKRLEAAGAVLIAVAAVLEAPIPANIQAAEDAADQLIETVTCYKISEIRTLAKGYDCSGKTWYDVIVKPYVEKVTKPWRHLKVCTLPPFIRLPF